MLLASSRFSNTSWKQRCLNHVKILLHDSKDWYMLAWAAHRESALLRMLGKISDSEQCLNKYVGLTVLPGLDRGLEHEERWNAQRGELLVSFAENLIQRGEFLTAKRELYDWHPLRPLTPSTLECIVLRSRDITMGKILRYEGRFQAALEYLEVLVHRSVNDEFYEETGWRRVLLSNVADLYCEMDRPADAQCLLDPELKRMNDKGCQNISSGRRLQLSLVESFLKRSMFDKAEAYLSNLQQVYGAIANPDTLSLRGIFRTQTCLARLYHLQSSWAAALSHWEEALKVLETLRSDEGFNSGIVRCSIAQALHNLGNHQRSRENFEKAKLNLRSERRAYWIVGFDSYWHDHVTQDVETLG